jgi:hypothetical protein
LDNNLTETALLTLQSMIAKTLNEGRQGMIYSIDLSAAFDLLKPDKFLEQFKDQLSEGLLFSLMDFLTGRKFVVDMNGVRSEVKELDRGCVQGSILGPKLFSLYMSKLKTEVGADDISIVSFADDTYVIVTPPEIDRVVSITESTLQKHIAFLKSIGMVVNETKTEVMWIGTGAPPVDHITVGNNLIKLSTKMKALGIFIQGNLSWDEQAEHAISKSKKLLSAFKFLRKYLTEEQFLKAASANYYGSVYYASSVWFHCIKKSHKVKLTSVHFRLLRTAKKDYMMKFKRNELTELCQRATPEQWAKFITASRVIKIVRNKEPAYLYDNLTKCYFEEKRYPGVGMFFDNSRIKKGQQALANRLLFMRSIKYPWNEKPMSDDLIRIEMKKCFFTFIQHPPPVAQQNQSES